MSDQIQTVKERTNIVSLIGSRVKLKPAGKYHKGLCPFHGEKSPSFFVSDELQIFKCFGCSKSGDAFTFLQEYEGLSFRESLEQLADQAGIELKPLSGKSKPEDTQILRDLLALAKQYYQYLLTTHPAGQKARDYLKTRGVTDSLVKTYALGFAPDSWATFTNYATTKKGFKNQDLISAGLAIQSKSGRVYDRFRGRIMFPLDDFRGRTVGFSGRLMSSEAKEAKYINTPETALYHKRELLFGITQAKNSIRQKDSLIVVEGELDAISSHRVGIKNIVAVKGSSLTPEQAKLILRITRNLVLCLDADDAGSEATKRAIKTADETGLNISILPLLGGKDPDELAKGLGEAWTSIVKKTISAYQFLIDLAISRNDPSSGTGKKLIIEELTPTLSAINNQVERAHYIKQVAQKLDVSSEIIQEELARHQSGFKPRFKTTSDPKPTDNPNTIELFLWGLMFHLPPKNLIKAWKQAKDIDWQNPGLSRLSKHLSENINPNFTLPTFVQSLPSELSGLVGDIYLQEKLISNLDVDKTFTQTISRLKQAQLQAKISQVTTQISDLENSSDADSDELDALRSEYVALTKQLSQN